MRNGDCGEKDGNDETEDEGVERGSDKEAYGESDDAEPFDIFVATDARGEIVADLFVEESDRATGGDDGETDEK